MELLPEELLQKILKELPLEETLRVRQVSGRFPETGSAVFRRKLFGIERYSDPAKIGKKKLPFLRELRAMHTFSHLLSSIYVDVIRVREILFAFLTVRGPNIPDLSWMPHPTFLEFFQDRWLNLSVLLRGYSIPSVPPSLSVTYEMYILPVDLEISWERWEVTKSIQQGKFLMPFRNGLISLSTSIAWNTFLNTIYEGPEHFLGTNHLAYHYEDSEDLERVLTPFIPIEDWMIGREFPIEE